MLVRLFRPIRHLLTHWPLQMVGAALAAVSIGVVIYTYQSSERVVFEYATESAQEHAESITQFRNFYAQELVPRAAQAGIEVTHDYKTRDNTLPLPATLTIEFITCLKSMAAHRFGFTAICHFLGVQVSDRWMIFKGKH